MEFRNHTYKKCNLSILGNSPVSIASMTLCDKSLTAAAKVAEKKENENNVREANIVVECGGEWFLRF